MADELNEAMAVSEALKRSRYSIGPLARRALSVGRASIDQMPLEVIEDIPSDGPRDRLTVLDSYDDVEIVSYSKGARPIYNILIPRLEEKEWDAINHYKEVMLTDPLFDSSFIKKTVQKKTAFSVDIKDILQPDANAITDIEKRKEILSEEVKRIIRLEDTLLSDDKLEVFARIITNSLIGYGPLEFLLKDDQLEEVMVLGENKKIYVYHRKHGMCSTNLAFNSDEEVVSVINRIASAVGRKIDRFNPLLDARLKDGSRVNATLKDITPHGATLTIRKFRADPMTIIDIIKNETISLDFAALLWVAVDGLGVRSANIIISGGTSSGKTTTLNCLATFIPEGDRIVSIEDTLELQLGHHEHWIRMETRPSLNESERKIDMNDCLINTLRMRPDRIIVGEVRGPEAETLFTAMNTGHDGCMGTVHANDPKDTLIRLSSPPMRVPLIMLPALDLIITQNRFRHPKKGYIRRVMDVSEVAGTEGDKVLMNKTFSYNIKEDKLIETGTPSRLVQDLSKKTGFTGKEVQREIEKRGKVLRWLVDNNNRSSWEVDEAVVSFNRNRDIFLEKMDVE